MSLQDVIRLINPNAETTFLHQQQAQNLLKILQGADKDHMDCQIERDELREHNSENLAKINELEKQLEVSNDSLKEMEARDVALMGKISGLENIISENEESCEKYGFRLKNLMDEKLKMNKKIREKEDEVFLLKGELEKIGNVIEGERLRFKSDLEKANKCIIGLKSNLDETFSELNKKSSDWNELEERFDREHELLLEKEAEFEILKENFDEIVGEIQASETRHQIEYSNLQNLMDEKVKNLKNDLEGERLRYQEALSIINVEVQKLEKLTDQLYKKDEELTHVIEELDSIKSSNKHLLEKILRKEKELANVIEEMNSIKLNAKNNCSESLKRIADQHLLVENLRFESNKKDELILELRESNKLLNQQTKNQKSEIATLTADYTSLNENLSNQLCRKDELILKLEDAVREESKKRQLEIEKSEIATLKAELSRAKGLNEILVKKFNEEVEKNKKFVALSILDENQSKEINNLEEIEHNRLKKMELLCKNVKNTYQKLKEQLQLNSTLKKEIDSYKSLESTISQQLKVENKILKEKYQKLQETAIKLKSERNEMKQHLLEESNKELVKANEKLALYVSIFKDPIEVGIDLRKKAIEFRKKGEFSKSIERFKKAIELEKVSQNSKSTLSWLHYWLGHVYYQMEDYEQSIANQTLAFSYLPTNIAPLSWRAKAHLKLGNKVEACEDCYEVLKKAPGNREIQDLLEKCDL